LSQWLKEGKLKSDQAKPIEIHWIQMSPELAGKLSYVTKLSRDPGLLNELMSDGERQAEALLAQLR